MTFIKLKYNVSKFSESIELSQNTFDSLYVVFTSIYTIMSLTNSNKFNLV